MLKFKKIIVWLGLDWQKLLWIIKVLSTRISIFYKLSTLNGDLIFIKKLSLFLLEIGEKEKAVDLSQYLLPSLAIHSILLEPFLKEFELD